MIQLEKLRFLPVPRGKIQLGAVAHVAEGDHSYFVFIVPAGAGGYESNHMEERLITVSPMTPIGRALLGKEVGDEIDIDIPSGKRTLEVLEIG
jgi:transcription elongation factor GreA